MRRLMCAASLIALVACLRVAPTQAQVDLGRLASPLISIHLANAGKPYLPNIYVTALAFGRHGLVYGGGMVMVKNPSPHGSESFVPSGSVVLISHDGGKTWSKSVNSTHFSVSTPWTNHHQWPATYAAQQIVIDPHEEKTIYVVGCYGSLACDYPEKAPGGDLLLKSTDGGNTWNSVLYFRRTSAGRPTESNIQTNIGMNSRFREMLAKHPDVRPAQVRAVAIGLTDNQDVYAVVPGLGFLRSTDAAKDPFQNKVNRWASQLYYGDG